MAENKEETIETQKNARFVGQPRDADPETLTCETCGTVFRTEEEFKEHLDRVHEETTELG